MIQGRPQTVRTLLGLILLAYLGLAAGYAVSTPRWNNPDEPAHFNYVRELAATGRLPVIQRGDWDAELLERLKAARFPDDAAILPIRYEAHQPPLYYLTGAIIYRLTERSPVAAQVLALRGLSIMFGAIVVAAAFAAGRELFPERADVGLLAAATAAFVPMHTAISAAVNNDSLANALGALTLVLLLRGVRLGFDDRAAILLGLVLGAVVLTKVTAYPYVPLGIGVIALGEWSAGRSSKSRSRTGALRRPALALAGVAAVASWWVVRNVSVYGWADPLAAARHAEVVVGQPQWARLDAAAADFFGRVLFRSFWGQFGWMGIVLPDRLYLLYLALSALAGLGLATAAARLLVARPESVAEQHERLPLALVRRYQFAVVTAAAGSVLAGVVAYNLTFIQPQGRYLFSALAALSLLLALGWLQAAGWQRGRVWSARLLAAILAGVVTWMVVDAFALLVAGRFWPARFVAVVALGVAAGSGLAARARRARTGWFAAAIGLGLGLLDLACLVRFVAPAFR